MDLLHHYETITGQLNNQAKSSFYIRSLASASSQATVHYVTGFQQHQLPITYLGCPVFTRCLELSHFDDMVQKVRDKISGWANRLLSFDGKLVLICHVLSSMSFHIFHVLQYLEHIFAQFLWGDSEGRHQIHWCRWLKVYYPIEEGGLGIQTFDDMAKDFELKLWCHFLEQSSLWAFFMKSKNCQSTHLRVA